MPGRPPPAGRPPVRPGAPPSRPAGGRGGRSPAGASGARAAGRRPMPCVEENGLLPGRGAPGRAPGRGPGVEPAGASAVPVSPSAGAAAAAGASTASAASGAAAAAAGASGSAGAAGAALGPGRGAAFAAGAGASTGAASAAGASGVAAGAVSSTTSAFLAGPGFAGAFFAAFFSEAAFSSSPNWSLNLLTTGGSTVDDADLTNSPISLSLARTTLLSTPSSLASSWTRTLATLLLLVRAPGWGGRTVSWCARSSRSTHRVLMS